MWRLLNQKENTAPNLRFHLLSWCWLGLDSNLFGPKPWIGLPRSSFPGNANFILQFLHFENTHAFPHPTSQLVNPRCPLNNPEQFSHTNLVCQINALIIKIVMQSEACVFQSYPINRLSLGQGYTPQHSS